MSNWREMLKEAKELFDDGLLDESEYKAEKARIMSMRSQSTNPGSTTPPPASPPRQAREEPEQQRKVDEERLTPEQQERLETAQDFAKEYKLSMAEIESKRKSLHANLETDIESAREPLNEAEQELASVQESLNERRTITASIAEMESTLADLESAFWSFMKGGQITTLKESIANGRERLSTLPSETDLASSIEIATQTVELSRATFNTAKENVETEYQTALNVLIEQESRLNGERQSIAQEFSSFMLFTEPFDIVSFGSGNGRHEMVLIPKGDFMMGALEDDSDACDDEQPRHKVTLTRDFFMGKYPVTRALWESVMGSNPSGFKGANRPVEKVSWLDVVAFCNKLSEREGLEPVYSGLGGYQIGHKFDDKDWLGSSDKATALSKKISVSATANGYRLPTEAEWEYSARSGQRYKYSGSDNVDEVAWYLSNSGYETHPVGEKKPNGFGLYDMSGNVYEWVWDIYGDYSSGSQTDPTGPDSGPDRVYRGGSWLFFAMCSRVSYRDFYGPARRDGDLGFRLSRSVQ